MSENRATIISMNDMSKGVCLDSNITEAYAAMNKLREAHKKSFHADFDDYKFYDERFFWHCVEVPVV